MQKKTDVTDGPRFWEICESDEQYDEFLSRRRVNRSTYGLAKLAFQDRTRVRIVNVIGSETRAGVEILIRALTSDERLRLFEAVAPSDTIVVQDRGTKTTRDSREKRTILMGTDPPTMVTVRCGTDDCEDGDDVDAILTVEVRAETTSDTSLEILRDVIATSLKSASLARSRKSGTEVSCITKSQYGGLRISTVGKILAPLNRSLYSDDVISKYDSVVRDLARHRPNGRLTIVSGPPGTGKTWLIKGLITEAIDATYMLIPASMITQMAGPDLLTVLRDHVMELNEKCWDENQVSGHLKSDASSRPIVLIVEDADDMVVSRGADNIDTISTTLNMGDGILGEALNIRMIATTNVRVGDIDPALTRKGRLSEHIQIDLMTPEAALAALQSLVPSASSDDLRISDATKRTPGYVSSNSTWSHSTRGVSLADVFDVARRLGWRPE